MIKKLCFKCTNSIDISNYGDVICRKKRWTKLKTKCKAFKGISDKNGNR